MQRKPMKRGTGFKAKPKARRAANPLKAGTLGKSDKAYKAIPRDRDHMARIAARGCLICGAPAQAHHVDTLTPKNAGPKVSDYLTAPLCPTHHTGDQNDCAHNGERAFWIRHNIDIAAWITRILVAWYYGSNPNAQAAIDAIAANKNMKEAT